MKVAKGERGDIMIKDIEDLRAPLEVVLSSGVGRDITQVCRGVFGQMV